MRFSEVYAVYAVYAVYGGLCGLVSPKISLTLVSGVSDHTHSEPFHVYSDLTEVTTVKAKITTNFTDNSLNDFIINL